MNIFLFTACLYIYMFDPKVVLGHCDIISWFSDFALLSWGGGGGGASYQPGVYVPLKALFLVLKIVLTKSVSGFYMTKLTN